MKHTHASRSTKKVKSLFETNLTEIVSMANTCNNEVDFKNKLSDYIISSNFRNTNAVRQLKKLIENDGNTINELSTGEDLKVETITLLWKFITNQIKEEDNIAVDLWLDLFSLFSRLNEDSAILPSEDTVKQWMKRWPSGLNEDVRAIRRENKKRIISALVKKLENRHAPNNRYMFPEGIGDEEKIELVKEWWKDYRFHLSMAIKGPKELNTMLGGSLSRETMECLSSAKKKGIPFFITPYYISLLNTTGRGYNDSSISTYILYSAELVDKYGNISAWEKEDIIEEGKPNAAGWLLPNGHNIHRRYPEVAILIPDSMGRACGGLCASCQRMYDFQSKRLNFDLEELKPKESWDRRLKKLMGYFENDTQLRDILITGGDALMSQNSTLRNILNAVYKMAIRKRTANLDRNDGDKYAEIQRVRLGTRLPVYLPFRVNEGLLEILKEFKIKASTVGVKQFIIQTHFQTPLEVTPEVRKAIKGILSTGWTITNQLVYNVAASRRGHSAKLRKVLNELGVICYYTFSVKGFDENYAVFTPNSRSIQEQHEEKVLGKLSPESQEELIELLDNSEDYVATLNKFRTEKQIPFIATDRNVLNLPGIGKSMTFATVGIMRDGKRLLEFEHDHKRKHSPIIKQMGKVYIKENKSIWQYLLQLKSMGEKINEYSGLWNYMEGETESRFKLYEYPESDSKITKVYSNISIEEGNV